MRPSFRTLFAGAFLVVGLCSIAPPADAQLGDPDLTVLTTLRDTYGWGKAFGWPTNTNPCPFTGSNWMGVTCDGGRVIDVVAICRNVRLNQPIPTILSQLTAVTVLDVRDCGLFGPIPDAITQMTQLGGLRLDENVLTGSIPSALGQFTGLGILELGNNRLTGAVPDFLNTRSDNVLLAGNFLTSIPSDWSVFDRDISYNCYPQPLPASCSETGFANNLCTPNRQDCLSTLVLGKVSGDGQRTQAGTVFANPLVVSLTDLSNNPLSNVPVTFSGPGIGSVTLNTDQNGLATASIAANSTIGGNTVTASTDPNTIVNFALTAGSAVNCSTNIGVTSAADSGAGSLREALADICPGGTVSLSQIAGQTIQLSPTVTSYNFSGRLYIGDSVTIQGNGVSISGSGNTRIFFIQGGNVTLQNLTLESGLGQGGSSQFGGSGAGMGGAIFQNGGTVTLQNVNLLNNEAAGGSPDSSGNTAGGGFGGNATGGDLGGTQGLADGAGGVAEVGGGAGGFGGGGGFATARHPSLDSIGGYGGFGGGGGSAMGANDGAYNYAAHPGFGGAQGTTTITPQVQVVSANPTPGASGAGFGGAIFQHAGTLNLQAVTFSGNGAAGGSAPTDVVPAQGKGGAIFVYFGGILNMDSATSFSGSTAAQAGVLSTGFSPAPYINSSCPNDTNPELCGINSNGTLCPGRDDIDICGVISDFSLTGPSSATYQSTFQVSATSNSTTTPTLSIFSGPCTISGNTVTVQGGNGNCVIQASWAAAGVYPVGTSTATVRINPSAQSCINPPANLTAWYKGEANANDNTGEFNATLGGDVSFATGEVGQAFSFDGSPSPYVAIPQGVLPASGAAFSFEGWFQTSSGGVILGQQNIAPYSGTPNSWAPLIYVGTDGLLRAQFGVANGVAANPITSSYKVNDGTWHHFALTYDGTTQTLYLDGVSAGALALSTQQIGTNVQLGTGYSNGWPSSPSGWYTFNGLIDEATIYSRALTAAEVLSIVNAGSNGKCNTESFYSLSGDNQTQVTTRTLPQPFIVQTTNGATSVTFSIVANNGTGGTWLPIGGFPTVTINGGSATVNVDVQGYATSPQLTLNSTPGTFAVAANDGVNTLVFNVTSLACTSNPPVNLTTDTGASGELRYAVNTACAGSTIYLTQLSGVITLSSRIRIDDSLTINGPGPTSLAISGNNQTRLFFIGNGTVAVNNLTLQNGYGKGGDTDYGGGGAGMGGAVFQNGGSLSLSGVVFAGNVAQGGTRLALREVVGGGGGFGGNGSGLDGGGGGDLFGIGRTGSRQGPSTNGGPGAGGAVYSSGGFGGGAGESGNGGFGGGAPSGSPGFGAGGGGAAFGGAIFQYSGLLTLVNDTFTNNQSVSGGSGAQAKGGSIFIYAGASAKATANGLTFNGSVAAQAGLGFTGQGTDAGYSTGNPCPGEDDTNVCGALRQVSLTGPASAVYGSTFTPATTDNGNGTASLSVQSGPCSVSNNVVTVTGANGTCILLAQWSATATYPAASATLQVSTTQRSVTPQIAAQNKTYNGTLTATVSCVLQNVLASDAANLGCIAASAAFANAGPGNNIQVTATGIALTGLAVGNYTLSSTTATTTANITAGPIAGISPGSLNFGTLYLGSIVTKIVTVSNTGNAAMTISDPLLAIISGGNSKEFVTVNLCPKSLAAGKSCSMTVTFIAGPFYTPQTATLMINDNAAGSPQSVPLSATVIDPVAQFSPTSLSFGTVKANSGNSFKPITVTSAGGTALSISNVAITGTNKSDYSETDSCSSGSFNPKATCSITVSFKPTAKGTRTATLVVTDNAFNSPQSIPLSGTGN